MMALASLILNVAGFALLACAMAGHHRELFGGTPSPLRQRILRAAGWLTLALSVATAVQMSGLSVGIVQWFGAVPVAATIVSLLVTCRKPWRLA